MRRPGWDELTGVIASYLFCPAAVRSPSNPVAPWNCPARPSMGRSPRSPRWPPTARCLNEAFASHGLGLVLLGADPLRPAERVNPGARYRAMETFFEASDTGAAGAAMMDVDGLGADQRGRGTSRRVGGARATGTRPRPDDDRHLRQLTDAGRGVLGWRSTRQRVWSQLDSARCGPVLARAGTIPRTTGRGTRCGHR